MTHQPAFCFFSTHGWAINTPSVAVASYSKNPDNKASTPATKTRAATKGLPVEAEAPLVLDDTVAEADPIVGLGTGPFKPFSATAAAESSANPIERGS